MMCLIATMLSLTAPRVKLMSASDVAAETFGCPRRKMPRFMRSMEKYLEMARSPVTADLQSLTFSVVQMTWKKEALPPTKTLTHASSKILVIPLSSSLRSVQFVVHRGPELLEDGEAGGHGYGVGVEGAGKAEAGPPVFGELGLGDG